MPDRRRKHESRQPERRHLNRRAFPRWELPFEVRYGKGTELVPGQGVEISESGMAFTGDLPFNVGDELDVRYRLNPEEEWVRVKVMVRHIEGNIVFGVEFLNLRLPDRLNILDYVSAKR